MLKHKTLRLTEGMIKAVCKLKRILIGSHYQEIYEAPLQIADAIIFLHEHANEMIAKIDIDTVGCAGGYAKTFVNALLLAEKSELVLSENLIQKILAQSQMGYSPHRIVEGEIIGVLSNLLIFQRDTSFPPTGLFEIILSYFQVPSAILGGEAARIRMSIAQHEEPCGQSKKRARVSDSSMFKSQKHAHGETPSNQPPRPGSR